MSELVTIVNRSSKPCNGTWNGRPYVFEPGVKHQFSRIQADAHKRQNIVMGSEDLRTGDTLSLLAILEDGDDTSPIEQTNHIERWDRAKLPKGLNTDSVEVVPGRTGIFSGRDVQSGPIGKEGSVFKRD